MGNFLKAGKSSQTRCTYFKPEGASSTLYPARVNANLTEFLDGPQDPLLSQKTTEVAESLIRESMALQSHLLWVTDLLTALAKRLVQPYSRDTIQPILVKVLEHQKWVQALLTDSLTTLALNAILVRRD